MNTSLAVASVVLVASIVTPRAAAEEAPPGALPAAVVDARPVAPSQYVEASSPAQADAILSALEAKPSSDVLAAATAGVTYGPCVLYPSTVYLRASSNYGAVGSKPYTQCSVPVNSIRHSTDLRYKSFIWWRLATTKTGGNSGVASYTQKNVEYYCVSKESTGWSGTTLGTMVYLGRTYYARVYQPVKTLACGG